MSFRDERLAIRINTTVLHRLSRDLFLCQSPCWRSWRKVHAPVGTQEVASVPEPQRGDFLKLFQLTAASFQEFMHILAASWTALCPCRGSCTSSGTQNNPFCTQELFLKGFRASLWFYFWTIPIAFSSKVISLLPEKRFLCTSTRQTGWNVNEK